MLPTLLIQTMRVIALSVESLPRRRMLLASTLLSVALVTAVLLTFLSMAQGFDKTLGNADSNETALILRTGAASEGNSTISEEQLGVVATLPGIARRDGAPQIAPEVIVIVSAPARVNEFGSDLTFRGLEPLGIGFRPGVSLVRGRMFRPGSNEVVVGEGLSRQVAEFAYGSTIRFGTSTWQVVGVFADGGNVFESEIWGDLGTVQRAFERSGTYQVIRAKLQSAAAFEQLKAALDEDERLHLETQTERDYYGQQANSRRHIILGIGWPLAILMGLGALVSAVNTMAGSISVRSRELATMRALGFRCSAVFLAILGESVIIALCGAAVGVLIVDAAFNGMPTSAAGSSQTRVIFSFSLSSAVVYQAIICALAIGFLGGLLPARWAARGPILAGMRK